MFVQIKIYEEFYHGIVDIANEGCHIRIALYKTLIFSDRFLLKTVPIGRNHIVFLFNTKNTNILKNYI